MAEAFHLLTTLYRVGKRTVKGPLGGDLAIRGGNITQPVNSFARIDCNWHLRLVPRREPTDWLTKPCHVRLHVTLKPDKR